MKTGEQPATMKCSRWIQVLSDQQLNTELREGVDDLDTAIRGDGNGTSALAARVRILEEVGKDTTKIVREWSE